MMPDFETAGYEIVAGKYSGWINGINFGSDWVIRAGSS